MVDSTATHDALPLVTEPVKRGRISRFIRSPLSGRFLVVVMAMALLTLWIYSSPGGPSIMWFPGGQEIERGGNGKPGGDVNSLVVGRRCPLQFLKIPARHLAPFQCAQQALTTVFIR